MSQQEELFDPRFVVVGDQSPPPPPVPPAPPKEKVLEDKLAETQKAYHELAGETASLRKMLSDLMARTQAGAGTASVSEPSQTQGQSWSEILAQISGGKKDSNSQPSLEDIQKLTRHEIAQTVQAIQYQQNVGQLLLNDFYNNHADLIPYANLVARLVKYGDPSKDLPTRYQEAIKEIRSMQEAGALPKHQPPSGNLSNPALYGRMPPVLAGGQIPYAVRGGQETEGIEYGDEYLKKVLKEWTDYRKKQLAKRKWQDMVEV